MRLVHRLSVYAWLCAFLQLALLTQGSHIPSSDNSPRAAFVTLAHEADLATTLISIQQLEKIFNSQYQYHWVFFSPKPLSEEFRRQTSNATTAICLYEVIAPQHWRPSKVAA